MVKSPIMGRPFELVAIDIVGPMQLTNRRNRYVLVVGDLASRFPDAYALPHMDAERVATALLETFS